MRSPACRARTASVLLAFHFADGASHTATTCPQEKDQTLEKATQEALDASASAEHQHRALAKQLAEEREQLQEHSAQVRALPAVCDARRHYHRSCRDPQHQAVSTSPKPHAVWLFRFQQSPARCQAALWKWIRLRGGWRQSSGGWPHCTPRHRKVGTSDRAAFQASECGQQVNGNFDCIVGSFRCTRRLT